MPYARFYKLAIEKREQLLDVAAQEFARNGFEGASINRILEYAQMSKGAAYYYFEDKVDLFITVVQYAMERLRLIEQELDIATLTAETFWPTFAELHRQPLLRSLERPWLFRDAEGSGTPVSRDTQAPAPGGACQQADGLGDEYYKTWTGPGRYTH